MSILWRSKTAKATIGIIILLLLSIALIGAQDTACYFWLVAIPTSIVYGVFRLGGVVVDKLMEV